MSDETFSFHPEILVAYEREVTYEFRKEDLRAIIKAYNLSVRKFGLLCGWKGLSQPQKLTTGTGHVTVSAKNLAKIRAVLRFHGGEVVATSSAGLPDDNRGFQLGLTHEQREQQLERDLFIAGRSFPAIREPKTEDAVRNRDGFKRVVPLGTGMSEEDRKALEKERGYPTRRRYADVPYVPGTDRPEPDIRGGVEDEDGDIISESDYERDYE